ncbi:unnamed protein product [Musa textilis]
MAAAVAAIRRPSARLPSILRSPFSTLAPHSEPPASAGPNPFSALRSAIHSESDPNRVAELFQSSAHLPRFHAHRNLFAFTVQKLARARRPDLVDRVLSPFLSDPRSPKSEGFLVRLISLYSSAGMPDQAAATFDRIPDLIGRPRSDKSLSALLCAYLHNRRFDLVIETFNRAPKELGISPGVISHNILMQSLCGKGDFETASNVLEEMGKKGVKPDIVSYNTLLSGYLKKGDDDRFEAILNEILNNKGLEPNVVTYNCRISKFCQISESCTAEELLEVMISKGIQPNSISFNTIIRGFIKEGDVSAAVRVFKRMRTVTRKNGSGSLSPNAEIYVLLIRGLIQQNEFCEALAICKECLTKKIAPPFEVVKGLIDGLLRDSKVDEARDVVAKMRTVTKHDAVDAWKKLEGALSL